MGSYPILIPLFMPPLEAPMFCGACMAPKGLDGALFPPAMEYALVAFWAAAFGSATGDPHTGQLIVPGASSAPQMLQFIGFPPNR